MAYDSDSPTDRLSEVRQAIQRCLTSQAYTIRGRQQQMAQLKTLREMERELQQESLESGNSGSMASVGQIDRPV